MCLQASVLPERGSQAGHGFGDAMIGDGGAKQGREIVPVHGHVEPKPDHPRIHTSDVDVAQKAQHAGAQCHVKGLDIANRGRCCLERRRQGSEPRPIVVIWIETVVGSSVEQIQCVARVATRTVGGPDPAGRIASCLIKGGQVSLLGCREGTNSPRPGVRLRPNSARHVGWRRARRGGIRRRLKEGVARTSSWRGSVGARRDTHDDHEGRNVSDSPASQEVPPHVSGPPRAAREAGHTRNGAPRRQPATVAPAPRRTISTAQRGASCRRRA